MLLIFVTFQSLDFQDVARGAAARAPELTMGVMTDGVEAVRPRVPATALAGLALATLAVFYLGVLPTKVLDLALDSISTIF